jgi:zona occludens toxin (predicted ATPase)
MKLITKTETDACIYYGEEEHSFVDGKLMVGDKTYTEINEGEITVYDNPTVPSDFHIFRYMYDGNEFTVAGFYFVICNQVRETRNRVIRETDWWAVSDRTMTQAQIDYRQALRDLPEQAGFPFNVVWPIYNDPNDVTDYSRPS